MHSVGGSSLDVLASLTCLPAPVLALMLRRETSSVQDQRLDPSKTVMRLLTRYRLSLWVVVITSFAASITSWQEFSDAERKTERYTRAAYGLNNLVAWRHSLSGVEKVSRLTIAELIHS